MLNDSKKAEGERGKKRNGPKLACEKRLKYRPEVTRRWERRKKANSNREKEGQSKKVIQETK